MKKMFTFTKNVAWLCEMATAWKQSLKFVDHQLDVASFFLLDAATSDTVSRSFEQRKWIWSSLNFRSRDTWERESFMVILPRRWSRVSDRFFLYIVWLSHRIGMRGGWRCWAVGEPWPWLCKWPPWCSRKILTVHKSPQLPHLSRGEILNL